jgi:hypothetical protein
MAISLTALLTAAGFESDANGPRLVGINPTYRMPGPAPILVFAVVSSMDGADKPGSIFVDCLDPDGAPISNAIEIPYQFAKSKNCICVTGLEAKIDAALECCYVRVRSGERELGRLPVNLDFGATNRNRPVRGH